MRTLDVRTNYNVLLVDFINGASKWDYFVGPHIPRYFTANYQITDEVQQHLSEYARIKAELGWDQEAELLNWAYSGFPENDKFSQLLEHLVAIAEAKRKDGKTLKEELESVLPTIQETSVELERQFNNLTTQKNILIFTEVFETTPKSGVLPAYITYSPDPNSSQGGANGEGIVAQVSTTGNTKSNFNNSLLILAHEFTHKELNPAVYFEKHFPEFDRTIEAIYKATFSYFIEEVIVYSLNDVLVFGMSPSKNLEHYRKLYEKDPSRRDRWVQLYSEIEKGAPVLKRYLQKEISKEELIEQLAEQFHSLIERFIDPSEVTTR